jgi:hypothetical protein
MRRDIFLLSDGDAETRGNGDNVEPAAWVYLTSASNPCLPSKPR